MEENKVIVNVDDEKFDELKKLAKPLQEWLTSHFNPMCLIFVETDKITVLSPEISTPIENG